MHVVSRVVNIHLQRGHMWLLLLKAPSRWTFQHRRLLLKGTSSASSCFSLASAAPSALWQRRRPWMAPAAEAAAHAGPACSSQCRAVGESTSW